MQTDMVKEGSVEFPGGGKSRLLGTGEQVVNKEEVQGPGAGLILVLLHGDL